MRLIWSLIECVNAPVANSMEATAAPFQWALDLTRQRRKVLGHRITFDADAPSEQRKNFTLAKEARRHARGILWWLSMRNDLALDEPALFPRSGYPKARWHGFEAADIELLEAPMVFQHFRVRGDAVEAETLAMWDRPSTCIAHALDLLLTDYRGLQGKVRACPFLSRETDGLRNWSAERVGRDHMLHFFVDGRFEKGQPMIYCTPQHRQTAYQRKYRREQTATKHK